jgi:hypothetical protein
MRRSEEKVVSSGGNDGLDRGKDGADSFLSE